MRSVILVRIHRAIDEEGVSHSTFLHLLPLFVLFTLTIHARIVRFCVSVEECALVVNIDCCGISLEQY